MEPLDHQRAALDEIIARAHAFYRGEWRELPVRPRWASLMVAPTGSGKTAVAEMATKALCRMLPGTNPVSMMRVSTPSWIPAGAHNRGTKETISVIAEHVKRHERTILVADEIEKVISGPGGIATGSDGTWQSYIRSELYDLLDGRWPIGLRDIDGDDMSEAAIEGLTTKLRHSVFVLAIGTFQDWHDSSHNRRAVGFTAEIDTANEELTAEIVAKKMPRELSNRLHCNLIQIPELRAKDYQRIAMETAKKLPLRMQPAFRAEVDRLLPAAISAKKGVRFVEEAMMATLIRIPPNPETITAGLIELGMFKTNDTEPCML